ncbi:hypothetical protein G3578_19320 [Brevibacillus sp. SYP-B805]|uniref:5' nucleotidase, NT5C type n=1 Tax=Brevibacillus sp. SYP-B805 TaxID=1578199 RepID=UPI0013ECC010|nr:hypothetical protein [Brevibacillus sp. SYP-B805]NGQ97292.1 hypothetical protein [Brevibacillus sp. SYP-B805]
MRPRKALTIGIDIDGTVTDPGSIVPLMNEAFGKNLSYADCTDYNLASVYNISDEQFLSWLDEYGSRLYREAPVHGNADEILRCWHREGQHRLVYISAREEKHLNVTLEWFKRNRIPYHEIDLIGSHDKLQAAQKWRVDLFLEDRLENALQLSAELQIPVFLFDTPYNQGALPPLVRRIYSWQEVHEAIHAFR